MGKGKPHPDETKAAVMAALAAGHPDAKVASRYKVPVRTVNSWSELVRTEIAEVCRKKKDVIEECIYKGLVGGMRALNEQQTLLGDRAFLERADTTCHHVAVAYGVLADKIFHLLEAAEFLRRLGDKLEEDRPLPEAEGDSR